MNNKEFMYILRESDIIFTGYGEYRVGDFYNLVKEDFDKLNDIVVIGFKSYTGDYPSLVNKFVELDPSEVKEYEYKKIIVESQGFTPIENVLLKDNVLYDMNMYELKLDENLVGVSAITFSSEGKVSKCVDTVPEEKVYLLVLENNDISNIFINNLIVGGTKN